MVKHVQCKLLLTGVLLATQAAHEVGGRVAGEVACLVPAQMMVKIYRTQELGRANVARIVVIIERLPLRRRVVLPLVLKKHIATFEGFGAFMT